MRPPSNPAHHLSTNRVTAGQLCPVALETRLLIFCTSLTLIRDRSCIVVKSMGHSSSRYTAVQQGKKTIEAGLKSFFCCFDNCTASLDCAGVSSRLYLNLVIENWSNSPLNIRIIQFVCQIWLAAVGFIWILNSSECEPKTMFFTLSPQHLKEIKSKCLSVLGCEEVSVTGREGDLLIVDVIA